MGAICSVEDENNQGADRNLCMPLDGLCRRSVVDEGVPDPQLRRPYASEGVRDNGQT